MNNGRTLFCFKPCPTLLAVIVAAVLLLQMSGCAMLKTDPAPDAGFIPNPGRLAPWPERAACVQRIWFKNCWRFYATRDRFTKICFRPTRVDYLEFPSQWNTLNSGGRKRYQDDVFAMANYVDDTLRKTFAEDPDNRFQVTETPDANTIVYEFAIVELCPTKVAENVGTTVLGFFIPLYGSAIARVVVETRGSIAVEVVARDGATNEPLLAWADRKEDRIAPCSIRDFEAYGHARKAVRRWAENLLLAWKTPMSVQIKDDSPLTLNPF
jgi:hypothetical protein